jgi:hypothetical protein
MSEETLNISLSKSEALVLFDLIARINENKNETVLEHDAERKILWKIETSLEKTLVEPLSPNYRELITIARREVNETY